MYMYVVSCVATLVTKLGWVATSLGLHIYVHQNI